jgi:hypothetical protein
MDWWPMMARQTVEQREFGLIPRKVRLAGQDQIGRGSRSGSGWDFLRLRPLELVVCRMWEKNREILIHQM